MKTYRLFLPVLFISVLTYIPLFASEFVGDDLRRITNLRNYLDQGWNSFLMASMPDRPVLSFSIYLNYILFGLKPISYKIISLIIHLLNGFLVFCLAQHISKRANIKSKYFALFVSTLFLIVPINSQAVHSVIQRGVLLSTFFGLSSYFLYLKFFNEKKTDYLLLASLSILVSIFSKPNGFIFIFINILMLNFIHDIKIKKAAKYILPNFLFLLFPLFMFKVLGENGDVGDKFSSLEYFAYQLGHIFKYIGYYFYPFYLRFIYDFEVNNIFLNLKTYLALFGHIFIFSFIIKYWKKKHSIAILLVLFYVSLIPESSFFSITHTFFDHRFYHPSIFLSLILVLCIDKYLNKKVFIYLPYLLIFYFSVTCYSHLNKTKTLLGFEKNNYKFNIENFNIFTSYYLLLVENDKQSDAIDLVDNWIFDNSYNTLKEIYKDYARIELLSEKQREILFNRVINYLSVEMVNNLDKQSPLMYNILIYKIIFQNFYDEAKNNPEKMMRIDKSLVPISAIMSKRPRSYSVIIKRHAYILKFIMLNLYKERNDIKNLARVSGQLYCYNIINEKELFKNDSSIAKGIAKRYYDYCKVD